MLVNHISKTRILLLFLTLAIVSSSGVWATGQKIFDIQIVEREVDADHKLIRVVQGDEVVFVWHTDETVSVHLHGYDIEQQVVSGQPARQSFTAHATGRFPVTSHGFANEHDTHGHRTLLYFEVYPE